MKLRDFLQSVCPSRTTIDRFLDEKGHRWARFDPELGYIPSDSVMQDGVDNSWSRYSYEQDGARRSLAYAGRPARIHTYGNSFTQCHQVSDEETWQEYLAGHLGEPIRNYGVGGYGVYQAWRRLKRHEELSNAASLLLLNVYLDDHRRNIMPYRMLHLPAVLSAIERDVMTAAPVALFFHSNPWSHMVPEPHNGGFREVRNLLDTPAKLYDLCSPDAIEALFGQSLSYHVALVEQGVEEANLQLLRAHGSAVGVELETKDPEKMRASAQRIQFVWGLRATMRIVDQVRALANDHNRTLLVLLSNPQGAVLKDLTGAPRPDQELIDYLVQIGQVHVDSRDLHKDEHMRCGGNPSALIAGYFIGHYSPRGNHFFAYGIKDTIKGLLRPPPAAYAPAPVGTAGETARRLA